MATRKIVTDDGEIIDAPLAASTPVFFKTPWNHDTTAAALISATVFNDESLAQQNQRDEVDINNILAKFGINAVRAPGAGRFLEVPEDMDMRTSLDTIAAARDVWDALPANVRQHFETMENYVYFVEQAQFRGDRKILQDLNLVDPDPVPPTPPAPPPAATGAPTPPAPTPGPAGTTTAPGGTS